MNELNINSLPLKYHELYCMVFSNKEVRIITNNQYEQKKQELKLILTCDCLYAIKPYQDVPVEQINAKVEELKLDSIVDVYPNKNIRVNIKQIDYINFLNELTKDFDVVLTIE